MGVLGLGSNTKLFVNENLTPYNQKLSLKCGELKRADFIYSIWSSKSVINMRQIQNKKPVLMEHALRKIQGWRGGSWQGDLLSINTSFWNKYILLCPWNPGKINIQLQ